MRLRLDIRTSILAVSLCAAVSGDGMLSRLRADSMLGSLHLGIPVSASDARGRALGGATSAITGEDFSFDNPARTVNFWRSGLGGTLSQDYRTLKTPTGSTDLRATEFLSLQAVFPVFKSFVVSWGIYQDRDLTWEYSDSRTLDFLDSDLDRKFSSTGNFYVSRLSIARPLSKYLALGVSADWMIGKADRQRSLAFNNSTYVSTIEQFNYRYSYLRPTFGILGAFKGINAGLAYTPSTSADVNKSVATQGGVSYKEIVQQDIPSTLRLGVSYRFLATHSVSFDYEVQGWSGIQVLPDPLVRSVDQTRIGIGYELHQSTAEDRRIFRRMPLRVGYSRCTYPFELGGNPVRENFFSFGSGTYLGKNSGRMDFAVELGTRKVMASGYPEEGVARIVVTISAFERWVSRPRRK